MRRIAISAFCLLLPSIASTKAQSSDQLLKDFRAQVLNQRLILQNFSGDASPNFEWTPNGLTSGPPQLRTLGVFKFSAAKVHNGTLVLAGSRSTIYKQKKEKPTLLGDTPVVIRIALNGADPAAVLPLLKQELFFPTLQAAVTAIPVLDRQMIYPTDEPSRQPPASSCPTEGAHYEHPKVIYQEEPDFTEEARKARFNGSVTVLLTVDEKGHPSDLWLKQPAGMGLDEQAIKAVSHDTFEPATCDGTEVKTPLLIEQSFSISPH
ncbi:MAG TPA: energy transducer TonB [Acidobacteriaceae bacterium]|nr:energy transducer TonB [Acidobacteriaceae bacterium]